MIKKKYSEIRVKLKIDIEKKADDGIANLTHYFQNHTSTTKAFFEPAAKQYLSQLHEKLQITDDPEFQYYLPLNWDIPFPPTSKPKFTFIDLFAGIGGIRLAYQNLGGKCVFTSEWNNPAKQTYEANFGEVPFGDITKISEKDIPDHDLLLAGFPCQPFSIAGVSKKNALGKAHGFLDETQGTLFFDIARIIDYKRPKAFMLENVKNLVSHDKGKTFKIISNTLRELGYTIHFRVLDSKHFVPQHRERIIIVGFNQEIFAENDHFQFPKLPEPTRSVGEILEKNPDKKYTLTENLWIYLQNYAQKHKAKGNGFGFGLVDINGITRTISARYYKDGSEALIPQNGNRPRRLTPRECARLQGYPDSFIWPVSDMQAYKQFGNSVTVPLIQAVGKEIVNEIIRYHESAKFKESICY
jgi:DNA (cytosine-5)-methyltransferase 1